MHSVDATAHAALRPSIASRSRTCSLLLYGGCRAVGAFLQSQGYYLQHVVLGGGLARPDFELPGGLVDEHFDARDDLRAALFGELQQASFAGIVNHVEDVA